MASPLSADTVNIGTYNEIAGNSTHLYFDFSQKTIASALLSMTPQ